MLLKTDALPNVVSGGGVQLAQDFAEFNEIRLCGGALRESDSLGKFDNPVSRSRAGVLVRSPLFAKRVNSIPSCQRRYSCRATGTASPRAPSHAQSSEIKPFVHPAPTFRPVRFASGQLDRAIRSCFCCRCILPLR